MSGDANQRDILIRYLLGELSDEEAEKIEERYFTDEDFFTEMVLAEQALFQAHKEGALSASNQRKFEARYLTNRSLYNTWLAHSSLSDLAGKRAARENEIQPTLTAKESAQNVPQHVTGSSAASVNAFRSSAAAQNQAVPKSKVQFWAAAAVIVMMVMSLALLIYSEKRIERERNNAVNDKAKLNEEITKKQDEIDFLQEELGRERISQVEAVKIPTITLGTTRSGPGGEPGSASLQISPETMVIRVQAPLPFESADSAAIYQISLELNGETILERRRLRPVKTRDGYVLSYMFSLEGLPAAQYKVVVKRRISGQDYEEVNSALFYLTNKQ